MKISTEDTRGYSFYTMLVERDSEADMSSLEDHLIDKGFTSEGSGDGSFEGFSVPKDDYSTKARFEKDFRAIVKKWKARR